MKNNQNNQIKNKLKILNKTKNIVSKKGWYPDIIKDLVINGVDKSELVLFFQNDYKKLLQFCLNELNKSHETKIKKIKLINFSISKRIKKILLERLKIINADKIFYKKTFNHLLLPQNSKIMKKNLYKSVDNMWYLAGDNSTDFNFYTKRFFLSIIYTNSLIILFNKGIEQSETSVEQNLKRIAKIPKLKERFSFIRENLPVFLKSIIN